jgi:chromosomal replication initiator protein
MTRAQDHQMKSACITEVVCQRFRVSRVDIMSARRGNGIANARQIAMWIAYRRTDWSYPQIGRMFGNRHHTTVMHAVSTIDTRMERDRAFAALVRDAAEQAERLSLA